MSLLNMKRKYVNYKSEREEELKKIIEKQKKLIEQNQKIIDNANSFLKTFK